MKYLVVCTAVFALLFVVTSPAAAVPRLEPAQPAITANNVGNCGQSGNNDNFSGQTNSSPNVSRSGVKAFLQIQSAFSPCAAFQSDNSGGPAVYVEISPRIQPSVCAPSGCAVRLGIIECANSGHSICEGNGQAGSFLETRGCSPGTTIHDLGFALNGPNGLHEVAIYKLANGTWDVRTNGALQYNIDPGGADDIDREVSCGPGGAGGWMAGNVKAAWMGRKWDGPGDSFGNSGVAGAVVHDARYGLFNQGWFSPGWPTNPFNCQYLTAQYQDTCKLQAADMVYWYTD